MILEIPTSGILFSSFYQLEVKKKLKRKISIVVHQWEINQLYNDFFFRWDFHEDAWMCTWIEKPKDYPRTNYLHELELELIEVDFYKTK